MAYRAISRKGNRKTPASRGRTNNTRRSAGGMSTQRKATEAAFKRGVKSGMRLRRANSRRAYFYG